MANKRSIKKQVRNICGQAAVDVLLNLPYDKARSAVLELATLQTRTLANASFRFDRSARAFADRRAYNRAKTEYMHAAYRKLLEDFRSGLQKIVDNINKNS